MSVRNLQIIKLFPFKIHQNFTQNIIEFSIAY